MAIHYSSFEYGALTAQMRAKIEHAAKTEFVHVPIVQKYKWAEPAHCFVATEGDFLVASVNLVARQIQWDTTKVQAAGVNNLITHEQYRGRGCGQKLMDMAMRFGFASMGAEVGILFCADDLLPFYTKLGWKQTNATISFDQPSGKFEWPSNRMWLARSPATIEAKRIDLGGLPW